MKTNYTCRLCRTPFVSDQKEGVKCPRCGAIQEVLSEKPTTVRPKISVAVGDNLEDLDPKNLDSISPVAPPSERNSRTEVAFGTSTSKDLKDLDGLDPEIQDTVSPVVQSNDERNSRTEVAFTKNDGADLATDSAIFDLPKSLTGRTEFASNIDTETKPSNAEQAAAEISDSFNELEALEPSTPVSKVRLSKSIDLITKPVEAPDSGPASMAANSRPTWEIPEAVTPPHAVMQFLKMFGPTLVVCAIFLGWAAVRQTSDKGVTPSAPSEATDSSSEEAFDRLVSQAITTFRGGNSAQAAKLLNDAAALQPHSLVVKELRQLITDFTEEP